MLIHTAARVSGHLKSTDCSDVSQRSAPDKEAAPEARMSFLLPCVCVCVSVSVCACKCRLPFPSANLDMDSGHSPTEAIASVGE